MILPARYARLWSLAAALLIFVAVLTLYRTRESSDNLNVPAFVVHQPPHQEQKQELPPARFGESEAESAAKEPFIPPVAVPPNGVPTHHTSTHTTLTRARPGAETTTLARVPERPTALNSEGVAKDAVAVDSAGNLHQPPMTTTASPTQATSSSSTTITSAALTPPADFLQSHVPNQSTTTTELPHIHIPDDVANRVQPGIQPESTTLTAQSTPTDIPENVGNLVQPGIQPELTTSTTGSAAVETIAEDAVVIQTAPATATTATSSTTGSAIVSASSGSSAAAQSTPTTTTSLPTETPLNALLGLGNLGQPGIQMTSLAPPEATPIVNGDVSELVPDEAGIGAGVGGADVRAATTMPAMTATATTMSTVPTTLSTSTTMGTESGAPILPRRVRVA